MRYDFTGAFAPYIFGLIAQKFISAEPLLESISQIDLDGIDWLIVGGESGPQSRPMEEAWVEELRDLAKQHNVPFFFKQWGGVNKKKAGRLFDGRTWDEMPRITNNSYQTNQSLCIA